MCRGRVRWPFTYLSQRHHYVLSFTHTLLQTRTIAELISKQTLRTLWTSHAPSFSFSLFYLRPIFIHPIHALTEECGPELRLGAKLSSCQLKLSGPSHWLFKWAKVQLKGKNFDFQWQSCGWAASSRAPYLIPLRQSCCWQHRAGLKNSTSILWDAL